MGREVISEFEVQEYEPNQMIYFHSISGIFPIRVRRSVEQQGSIPRFFAVIEGDPDGLMKLFSPFVLRMMRNNIEADYRRLKNLLES